jgi:hypothetical protein
MLSDEMCIYLKLLAAMLVSLPVLTLFEGGGVYLNLLKEFYWDWGLGFILSNRFL